MKQRIDSRQIHQQHQTFSYHQRFELDILEASNIELNEIIQSELESNPCLEQDILYETGYVQKEKTNYELLLNYAVKEKTLSEELQEQIRWYSKDIHTDLAIFITDMLDSNGYLLFENKELLRYFPQYNLKDIEKTIKILQTMEPPGVAARNLSECLSIQLSKMKGKIPNIAKKIVNNFLIEVATNRTLFIAGQINESLENVQKAITLIKKLEPRPGAKYSSTSSYLYPDLYCYIENQEIHIELMNETYGLYMKNLPRIKNKEYKSWNHNARILISAIQKRNSTLLNIGHALCQFQKNYFLYSTRLKPCTMKQIADICNVHESTVSRSISGKSVAFNNHVIPLKYFFPKGLENDSITEIQDVIRELIEKEDSQHLLSDEKISEKLAELDYQISRRTIAKYRKIMNIPSSTNRKK